MLSTQPNHPILGGDERRKEENREKLEESNGTGRLASNDIVVSVSAFEYFFWFYLAQRTVLAAFDGCGMVGPKSKAGAGSSHCVAAPGEAYPHPPPRSFLEPAAPTSHRTVFPRDCCLARGTDGGEEPRSQQLPLFLSLQTLSPTPGFLFQHHLLLRRKKLVCYIQFTLKPPLPSFCPPCPWASAFLP